MKKTKTNDLMLFCLLILNGAAINDVENMLGRKLIDSEILLISNSDTRTIINDYMKIDTSNDVNQRIRCIGY